MRLFPSHGARWRVPIGMIVGIGVAVVMACGNGDDDGVDDNQFRDDVFGCEEAVSHLLTCCGSAFDPSTVSCHHLYVEDQGCGSNRTITRQDPDFSVDETDCMRDQSCDVIRKTDVCGRSMRKGLALQSGGNINAVDDAGARVIAAVCP